MTELFRKLTFQRSSPSLIRSSLSTIELSTACQLSGDLYKQSHTNPSRWMRRHVVLDDEKFAYYAHVDAKEPSLSVSISEISKVNRDETVKGLYTFSVSFVNGDQFVFGAKRKEKVTEWITALSRAINARWMQQFQKCKPNVQAVQEEVKVISKEPAAPLMRQGSSRHFQPRKPHHEIQGTSQHYRSEHAKRLLSPIKTAHSMDQLSSHQDTLQSAQSLPLSSSQILLSKNLSVSTSQMLHSNDHSSSKPYQVKPGLFADMMQQLDGSSAAPHSNAKSTTELDSLMEQLQKEMNRMSCFVTDENFMNAMAKIGTSEVPVPALPISLMQEAPLQRVFTEKSTKSKRTSHASSERSTGSRETLAPEDPSYLLHRLPTMMSPLPIPSVPQSPISVESQHEPPPLTVTSASIDTPLMNANEGGQPLREMKSNVSYDAQTMQSVTLEGYLGNISLTSRQLHHLPYRHDFLSKLTLKLTRTNAYLDGLLSSSDTLELRIQRCRLYLYELTKSTIDMAQWPLTDPSDATEEDENRNRNVLECIQTQMSKLKRGLEQMSHVQ